MEGTDNKEVLPQEVCAMKELQHGFTKDQGGTWHKSTCKLHLEKKRYTA